MKSIIKFPLKLFLLTSLLLSFLLQAAEEGDLEQKLVMYIQEYQKALVEARNADALGAAKNAYELALAIPLDARPISTLAVNYVKLLTDYDKIIQVMANTRELVESQYGKNALELVAIHMYLGQSGLLSVNDDYRDHFNEVIRVAKKNNLPPLQLASLSTSIASAYLNNQYIPNVGDDEAKEIQINAVRNRAAENTQLAESLMQDAKKIYEKAAEPTANEAHAKVMFQLAHISFEENDCSNAKKIANEGLTIPHQNTLPGVIYDLNLVLASCNHTQKNFKESDEYIKNIIEYLKVTEHDYMNDYLPFASAIHEYPPMALSESIEGWAKVTFQVDTLGYVQNPVLSESSDLDIFGQASLDSVLDFRYVPRVIDGQAVVTDDVEYTFTFELE